MTKRLRRFGLVFAWLAISLPAVAQTSDGASPRADAAMNEATEEGEGAAAGEKSPTVCELIEQAARTHGIPVDFFTRLVWQESRFRSHAISPKGAQGIAQFMPGTAALRGLADPFDPQQAIPASAKYLAELSRRFGNQGFAAIAYNAGEQRLADWLAGTRGLPGETRAYVTIVTGRAAEEWTIFDPNRYPRGILPGPAVDRDCLELAALLAEPGAGSERLEAIAQADWAPWGAQVAGNFSRDKALGNYRDLEGRHPKVIGGRKPMVVRQVNRSRGPAPLFLVRIPAESRDEAAAFCKELRAASAPCVVFKN